MGLGLVQVEPLPVLVPRPVERARHVLAVVEPDVVADVDDAVVDVAQVVDHGAVDVADVRHVLVDDGDDRDPVVQDVVELHVLAEGQRRGVLVGVGEDGESGHAGQGPASHLLDEVLQRSLDLAAALLHDPRPRAPGQHHGHHHAGHDERQPAAVEELGHVGGEEHRLDPEDEDHCGRDLPHRHPPHEPGEQQEDAHLDQ